MIFPVQTVYARYEDMANWKQVEMFVREFGNVIMENWEFCFHEMLGRVLFS